MELTTKQKEGLEIAVKRFKENKPYTCIAGYSPLTKSINTFKILFIIIERWFLNEINLCFM